VIYREKLEEVRCKAGGVASNEVVRDTTAGDEAHADKGELRCKAAGVDPDEVARENPCALRREVRTVILTVKP